MPTLFLSSTIRDLADLRSAIKYWLEQYGFEVLASEWPDFPHALDKEAMAAALAPIELCDYYLLIVGYRSGMVIPDEGISATWAEFRYARALRRKTGRPKMLHLVRREVAEARGRERPEHVETTEWPRIESFLEEVRAQGEKDDPNWLNTFSSFRDVADVLRTTLRISGPLVRRALEANLLWELSANTRDLLERGPDEIRPHTLWFPNDVAQELPLSKLDESVRVDRHVVYGIVRFRLTLRRGVMQSSSALEEAIKSGAFLDYHAGTDSYIVSPFQVLLLELRQQTRSLDGIINTISTDLTIAEDFARLAEAARLKTSGEVRIYTARFLYAAWAATMNVLRLNRATYRGLLGLDAIVQMPELDAISTYDEQEKMEAEGISEDEAKAWLMLPPDIWRIPIQR